MPRHPKLADNLADRLVLNPKRPPDPTYRFHRHHPRPRSPNHTRGSIRRFGAGSLFDADHPRSRVTLPRCFPITDHVLGSSGFLQALKNLSRQICSVEFNDNGGNEINIVGVKAHLSNYTVFLVVELEGQST